ncbi:MAG: response regulator [Pyrinomonadaceae bacterium]|nr:response regulator [Pyrinomonadaceae bacterium]
MLNIALSDLIQTKTEPTRHRRALVIVNSSDPVLPQQLAVSGYESYSATTETARQAINEFAPDVAVFEIHQGGEKEAVALARRLRNEAASYALPIVFVWTRDDRVTRNAALNIGVDDYFALSLPFSDVLVRLDSLFWRIEAGRRTAAVAGDQRLEIDNFMLLLDSVREDIEAGRHGAIAVINAAQPNENQPLSKQERDRVLAEVHGFLKLYLRRVDTVAFYGPTTLLVYLPRMDARDATEALLKLQGDFSKAHPESLINIGLAAFPEDGTDVEGLIEKAESEAAKGLSAPATKSDAREAAQAPLRVVEEAKALVPEPTVSEEPVAVKQEAKPVEAAPVAAPVEEQKPKPAEATAERKPARVEKKAEVAEAARSAPTQRAAQPEKPRVEKFVSHVVREKRVDDSLDVVAAPPPVRRGSVQTNGAEAQRAAEAAARERERRARGTIMPRRLLLTVSDAARMAQLNSLIRSAGYEARAAFGGQQALDLLRIERPDLLLLDFELQGIDGLETLRRLRKQNGGRLTLPVVLLLPENSEAVRQEALALGTRGIVSMPYDPVDLLDTVRAAGVVE